MNFFVSVPAGLEALLAEELRQLGITRLRPGQSGVSFTGSLEKAMRVCLWSRVASRVLLPLHRVAAATPEELYAGVLDIPWEEHMSAQGTLGVEFKGVNETIRHTRFGAQKVKDAIVDRLRNKKGQRPSVAHANPDLLVHVRLREGEARIGLDLAGGALHRRGYRTDPTAAPVRENLAAAILMLCNWPELARQGMGLFDPLCGSGTFLIEGAWMAGGVAPGLLRPASGGRGWSGWEEPLWQRLVQEAEERRQAGQKLLPPLLGSDLSPQALRATRRNADQAGVAAAIRLRQEPVAHLVPDFQSGLLVTNPPYGQRLGESQSWVPLYQDLGELLRSRCRDWPAGVLAMDNTLPRALGLEPETRHPLRNGPLLCNLLVFSATRSMAAASGHAEPLPATFSKHADALAFGDSGHAKPLAGTVKGFTRPLLAAGEPVSPGQEMFANRLRKNLRTLGKWARREGIHCYRVYAADMPEYALAVDLYDGYVHVQEYHPPASVDPDQAAKRLHEALSAIPGVLGLSPDRISFKVRRRQKGDDQYQKRETSGTRIPVREGRCRFLINLSDYLDVGLFLDHRQIRAMLGELARGRHFLNLFGYTGTATVHAAAGGALSTTTVDMSAPYLQWARANLDLNGLADSRHRFIEADCLEWIDQQREQYDLIFLDPPTFSNSKRMMGVFEVQRDHVDLIIQSARLLAPGGVMIFSNNFKKFKPNWTALPPHLEVTDLTAATIPLDFHRQPDIHHCWKIELRKS
ncbi:MAG: bifunctional 23S rRNA (guanine(2069)-N(7))-methyltransferase RlmK/23S rRNA (guanine(2445)-N(2))-methyltransferase RlmL [Magnetococcales bacterium]|nr:bifunctional 23S rRNA (guanine(2069)-N(7))-methyltransferase RlmK/23S rRNA (guanine(2445)-N(2))-methyltransferase RlmL [Magnetococcales bacterium]